MQRIYKYQLKITDNQVVEMPMKAKILSVGEQYGSLVLWAIVDIEQPTELRHIAIIA